jgi:PA14 domain
VNDWYFNAQRPIPGYLLYTPGGISGGLQGTYFADLNFKEPMFTQQETPNRDWGLFPPDGLPSSNFSVVWEGTLQVPVDSDVHGWIGVATSANCTAKLYVDDVLVLDSPFSSGGTIQSNIPGLKFTQRHSTDAPSGGSPFTFKFGAVHKLRLEFQAFKMGGDQENTQTFNSKVELFWNLVDRDNSIEKVATTSFLICSLY